MIQFWLIVISFSKTSSPQCFKSSLSLVKFCLDSLLIMLWLFLSDETLTDYQKYYFRYNEHIISGSFVKST